jgi:hypothetical protein
MSGEPGSRCSVIELGPNWTEFTSDSPSVTMERLRTLAKECEIKPSRFEGRRKIPADTLGWLEHRRITVMAVTNLLDFDCYTRGSKGSLSVVLGASGAVIADRVSVERVESEGRKRQMQ